MQAAVNKQQGVTLIEIMVGMAVFIVLVAVGVPGYMSYVRNSQISSSTINLFSDIYFARSTAIKRKTDVYVCRSSNAQASPPSCSGSNNTWSGGWLIFVDGAGGTTGTYDSANDELLRVGTPANTSVAVMTNASADANIQFESDGTLNLANGEAIFALCDDRDDDGDFDEAYGREVRVTPVGRAEILSGSISSCDTPA